MNCIELQENQIERKGRYAKPLVDGYNSLFHHQLTRNGSPKQREDWGYELTVICEEEEIDYFCFQHNDKKINVYPNELIESWWNNR